MSKSKKRSTNLRKDLEHIEEFKSFLKDRKEDNYVLAVSCADLHCWLRPPIARSDESDWLEAMKRPILQLQLLCEKYHCPLIIVGDITDGWKAPPELINWLIHNLTFAFPYDTYAVAGNHDLPLHSYEDIEKSAYWTLVKSKAIKNLKPNKETLVYLGQNRKKLSLTGFPYGCKTKSFAREHTSKDLVKVAVVHDYCYDTDAYPGVDPEKHYLKHRKRLEGFDIALFGDNHKPFIKANFRPHILNHGCLIRRRSDEKDQKVYAGLIYSSGDVGRVQLDTSKDVWTEVSAEAVLAKGMVDLSKFIEEMDSMGDHAVDFVEAVVRSLDDHKVRREVRELVLKILEKE